MDGWLGALVSLSLVVAAAPTLAVVSPAAPVEDATISTEDDDPRVAWGTSLLVDVVEPRLYLEASLEDGNSTATLELRTSETETEVDVMTTPNEDDPLSNPLAVEAESGEGDDESNACVNIYLPQTPPFYIDPDCLPEIDDTSRPLR